MSRKFLVDHSKKKKKKKKTKKKNTHLEPHVFRGVGGCYMIKFIVIIRNIDTSYHKKNKKTKTKKKQQKPQKPLDDIR